MGGGGAQVHLVYQLSFSKIQEEVQHFPRGVQLLPEERGVVSHCLFSIETHITCDFPVSPSGSAHEDTTIGGLKLNLPPRTWSYLSFKTVKVH